MDELTVCPKCFIVNEGYTLVCETQYNNYPIRKVFTLYNRRNYFREKLKKYSKLSNNNSDDYKKIINMLKKKNIKNIHDLKHKMRKLKLNKYRDFLYTIYHDIKGVKLINLNDTDITNLCNQFHNIERNYNKTSKKGKSMLNYDVVLYYLLKKNNFQCYTNIPLPYHWKKVYDNLLKII